MIKRILLFFVILAIAVTAGFIYVENKVQKSNISVTEAIQEIIQPTPLDTLSISYLRSRSYSPGNLKIEQTLENGSNYKRYIASYLSEGLTIYGLMTVPNGQVPNGGFPVIIFNHGYITPERYTADGNYIAYVDALAKAGYVVFKPDYRGNGKSQGMAGSSYFSSNYDIDDLNAIASIETLRDPSTSVGTTEIVNRNKIGVWGHSMGGHITLVDLVVANSVKAAVIWGGVVGSYNDILYNWQSRVAYKPDPEDLHLRNLGSADLINKYGTPLKNPDYWNSIDPTANLNYVNAPVQIHVGLADDQVPPDFSQSLYNKLWALGKTVEIYTYPGANHDIGGDSFNMAMQRTISFFDKYLK